MTTSCQVAVRTAVIPFLLAVPLIARSQDTTRAKRDTTPSPVQTPPPAVTPTLPFDFSGVLYASYQSGGSKTERRTSQQNRFDLDRAYLNFRAPAGDHMSIRVTTDVYQQRDSTRDQYYRGWAVRLKYAYAQYDYIRGPGLELKAVARLGMLHTPIIDYEEQFWPRGIAQTAVEQNGYFSSSDLGFATLVTMPNRWGELYGGVYNGSGYTSRENDRFKDYGARLTITPFNATHGILRTFSISPWAYVGYKASDFLRGPGSLDPVTQGREKNRYGVFLSLRDPRIVLGSQFAWKVEQFESVADTLTVRVPTVVTRTAPLLSAYTVMKPLAFFNSAPNWPLNVVLRYDHVKPDDKTPPYNQFIIGGVGIDLNKRAQLWLDYQDQDPKNGSTAADIKTFFVQAIVNF
jgi:hypothetical protein